MRTLDEARAQRDGGTIPRSLIDGWTSIADSATVKTDLAVAADALVRNYQAMTADLRMYVDRVAELDGRLAVALRERDEARERAGQWDIDRHTEKQRADRLQVAASRDVTRLTRERDEARQQRAEQTAHLAGPNGPWAQLRMLRAEMATLRGDLAQVIRERDERVEELERQALRDIERIKELNGWLDARDRAQNLAQAEVVRLREELTRFLQRHEQIRQYQALLGIIRDALAAEEVSKAVGVGVSVTPGSSLRKLADAVAGIRSTIQAANLLVLGFEEREAIRSEWDGPTCGEQCRHEVSPVPPVSPES